MKIRKIEHVGIATKDAAKARDFYVGTLGLAAVSDERHEAMKLRIVKIRVGETVLELVEPLAGETAVRKFIETRGEGVHHVCFEVDDVKGATAEAHAKGCRVLWPEPRTGAGGKPVNFLHPSSSFGVLIEFNQPGQKS